MRPVIAYLPSGESSGRRDGQGEIVHKPGEQWAEGAGAAHWSEIRVGGAAGPVDVDVLAWR